MADGLYETDLYAWTQHQARVLRERGAGSNTLEWDNLAEEIETLGRSEAASCESHITNILLHFLKLHLVQDRQPKRYRRAEIKAFRIGLKRHLSPSLRARLQNGIEPLYADARSLFVLQFEEGELISPAPETYPWTFDDILGRGDDWVPA